MTNTTFLTAYDRAGSLVARVTQSGAQWTISPALPAPPVPSLTVAFSRLVLTDTTAAPVKQFIIDVLTNAGGGVSSTNSLQFQFAATGEVTQITFRGRVRCYLNQSVAPWLDISGTLVPAAGTGNPTLPQFSLGGVPFQGTGISSLGSQVVDLPVDSQVPLFSALGLTLGSSPRVSAGFTKAPVPASSNPSGDNLLESASRPPSDQISVLQFVRTVTLASQSQSVRAGLLEIDLDAATVARANLDTRVPPNWPITLIQTHLALNSDGEESFPACQWVVSIAGLPHLPLLRAFNALAGAYHASLQTVQDGRAISGVPLWEATDWPVDAATEIDFRRRWTVTVDVSDQLTATDALQVADFSTNSDVKFRAAFQIGVGLQQTQIYSTRLYLARFPAIARHDYTTDPASARSGILTTTWQFECPTDISPLTGAAEDQAPTWASVWQGFVLQMYPVVQGLPSVQSVRFGALDLSFAGTPKQSVPNQTSDPPSPRTASVLTLGLRNSRGIFVPGLPTSLIDLRMMVDRAMPGGQDGLPNEIFQPVDLTDSVTKKPADAKDSAIAARFVREPPLLVPLGATDGTPSLSVTSALLRLRESTAVFQSQQITAQLFQWTNAGTPLSDASQRLVVIDREPLLVALVVAPPLAGIGGADGALEIGNWHAGGQDGASWDLGGASQGYVITLPPQAVGEGEEKSSNVVKNLAASCRLGPAATARVTATDVNQNFTEPVWNLRRILGYVGQRSPGAGVIQLDFELLYGMGCTVKTLGTRLAELESRLGAVPAQLPPAIARPFTKDVDFVPLQDRVFDRLRYRWSRQYAAYASRLGVFELWSQSQPGLLRISDGVSYLLRDPAPITQDPATPGQPPDHLDGGPLWGMDFESEYAPFRDDSKQRASTYGELSRPAFSALGGWGYQKAVFQGGLTTIYSDTAMGRTFFYSLERRGRIAGFWNFAKHVVIFERTTGTSKQFAPDHDQSQLAGRPVLRKVREFIELIQPTRSYPDFGAEEITRGCVLGIDFKTKIIPVDGKKWGHDVLDTSGKPNGYVIPLWQLGEDPSLYPKPHVALRIAGASDANEDLPVEIDEPQKLLFYSPAELPVGQVSLDSDQWPAVCDVDFPDLAFPAAPQSSVSPDSDIEAQQPDAPAGEPGYDPFTYAVVAHKPANLVAARTSKTLGATLHNVTMVRSNPVVQLAPASAPGPDAKRQAAQDFHSHLSTARSQLDDFLNQLSNGADPAAIAQQLGTVFTAFSTSVTSASQSWTSLGLGSPDVQNWDNKIKQSVNQFVTNATSYFSQNVTALAADLANLSSNLGVPAAIASAQKQLNRAWSDFDLAVPGIDPGVGKILDGLNAACNSPPKLASQLLTEARQFLQQAESILDQGTDPLTADAKAGLAALSSDLQLRLTNVVNQVLSVVSDPIKKSVDAAITKKISDAVSDVVRTGDGLIAKWGASLSKDLAGPVAQIRQDLQGLEALVDSIQATVQNSLQATIQNGVQISGVCTVFSALSSARAQAIQALQNIPVGGTPLSALLDGNAMKNSLASAIGAATSVNQIATSVQNVATGLQSGFTAVTHAIANASLDLSHVVSPLQSAAGILQKFDPNQISSTLNDLSNGLNGITGGLTATADPGVIRAQITGFINQAHDFVGNLVSQTAAPLAAAFPDGIVQTASNTLRLVRAFADAPLVNGMAFNRNRLAYYYDPTKLTAGSPIDITPATALVNRVGNYLKATGISLPTGSLLDQVLPVDDLKNFDFGKLLPDFAGLKLDKLLPDLKAPDNLADAVKITHSFDQQSGRGWVQADVNITVATPTTLFDAGPIKVSLRGGPKEDDKTKFTARMRIEAGLSGTAKRTQNGQLQSTLDLSFGGTPMVTFRDTTLTFDDSGKTHFNLDPKKVELNGVLSMLSDVLAMASDPDDGFTLKLLVQNGFPAGVEAQLELALPDMSFGVCDLSDLSFGARLDLVAFPDFMIGLRVHLSEKRSPFTLIVFFLGGGGWLTAEAQYYPLTSRVTTAVSLGLNAGAMLAIGFGPVNGSVYAFFYVEGELQTDSAQPGSQHLTIRIGLLLGGEVDVASLITVSIQLLLELEYAAPELIGRGTLSIHVKICFFLSIDFDMAVEKRFAGSGNNDTSQTSSSVSAHLDQQS